MNDDFNKVAAWLSLLFNADVTKTKQTQEVMLFNAPIATTNMYKHYFFPYAITEWNLLLVFLVTLFVLLFYR